MDVLHPPDTPPIQPSEYPQIPTRTPPATLEKLHACCVRGDIQKFREILDLQSLSSEDFSICDFHMIMLEAIRRHNIQFIQELLDRGLPMDSLYALEAIKGKGKKKKKEEALEAFLQNGWNINQPVSELKPPVLGYAIADQEIAAWLLDHGADPNQQCIIDLTPLSLAVERASIEVIQLMLGRGGDARKGQLLHHGVERDTDDITVLRLLIANGAAIDSTMYEDHYSSRALFHFMSLGTALHKAVELGKVDVVRYLVDEGANLGIRDANGRTALEYARMLNRWEVVRVFENGS